jgi:hypothetical protein
MTDSPKINKGYPRKLCKLNDQHEQKVGMVDPAHFELQRGKCSPLY